MKRLMTAIAALALATGVSGAMLFAPTPGLAHGPQQGSSWGGHGMGPGMMGGGYGGQQRWHDRGDCPYRDQSRRGSNRNMMGGGGHGPGMMGGGMMGPGMMGGGMMGGGGYGPGMRGQGMMGQGMMGGGMMGPGMMDGGMMGGGMMGWGPGVLRPLPEALSADDVRQMMERRLAWSRNPNLKVGAVEAKDDDTIEATVVTQDGSLVQTFKVDRSTGWMQPAEQ
ncbi:hypothetical protein [Microbaculum marinisediminis]|uniref:YpeB-like protein with protease inhibitory function n=1 Tax=Microbaculum marinisediminis TaxID=2931392 RepID=A0AAW5QZJ7_9HYPH|nr:hypothetical protein [Microbaculum sp. A6E488]MCT8971851.1 hypothetical protein [Microbaculum sp. A6E488]